MGVLPVRIGRSLAVAVALAVAVPAWAQERQKQVLVLYGTRQDAQIVAIGDSELPPMLSRGDATTLDYYSESIDAARFSQQPAYEVAFRDSLRLKYEQHRFDLVIAMGAVPLAFVEKNRRMLFHEVPVVFFSEVPREAIPDSTGLVSELNLRDTAEFGLALQPDLRHLFVITSAEGSFRTAAEAQLATFRSRLDVTFLTGLTSDDLEKRIAELPDRSAVYYVTVDRDRINQNYHPLVFLDSVTAASRAPVYSWVDSTMGHGVVGGSMKDQRLQVREIGALALRVLGGEPAASIPVVSRSLLVRQVDWRQLQRWGMSDARLPQGTRVLFREPSVWERDRPYILAAIFVVLAQMGLIAGLLIQRARRRKAEAEVRGSQAALRASYDRIRDLGTRLLGAQEGERARIARELHDDISQQLALLQMDLEQLRRTPADRGELTDDALDRTTSIARSVHDLSHRLHPAKLRLIGLVGAIKGLQREFSQSDMGVTVSHAEVPPALSQELTLCIFRVVQEALQNALKYSKARRVLVQLVGGPERLDVSIFDDGVGFDVAAATGGIGLISMRERVEGVGGTFDIQSAHGTGTRLVISVPVRPADAPDTVAV